MNGSGSAAVPFTRHARPTVFGSMLRDPMVMTGMSILLAVLILTLAGPFLIANDPVTVNMSERLLPPAGNTLSARTIWADASSPDS